MNRAAARKIAETITNEQLQEMFNVAKSKITDWEKVSTVNIGMTKGAAWNILAANFDIEQKHHILGKTNMVREFGEFLPKESKPINKKRKQSKPPHHQEPQFLTTPKKGTMPNI